MSDLPNPRSIAIGPVMPGWGSWEWLGADLALALAEFTSVSTFQAWELPDAEIVIVIKHLPPPEWFEQLPAVTSLVYTPVDLYGSCAEIDAAGILLFRCQRIVIHCERLRKYFAPYSQVVYLDHHLKYVATPPVIPEAWGPILWVGVRPNLPPLVDWVNRHPLPADLVVLTDVATDAAVPTAAELGFTRPEHVRVERWSASTHRDWLPKASAAIDIKGGEFRSRHKSPAKALDFLASGLPLALNPESSPAEHLANLGFRVPSPLDITRWMSPDYAAQVQQFALELQHRLSLASVAKEWIRMLRTIRENS